MTTGAGGEVASSAGFSSRSTSQTITQFPQRDEALMFEMEPGFSNSKPTKAVEPEGAEEKVVDAGSDQVEDKAVKPAKRTAKKS